MMKRWYFGKFRFFGAHPPELRLIDFANKNGLLPGQIVVLSHSTEKEPRDNQEVGVIRFMYYTEDKFDTMNPLDPQDE